MRLNQPKTQIKRFFSLIELLIVVAIIAILAAIAVPAFQKAKTKAQIGQTEETIRNLQAQYAEALLNNSNDAKAAFDAINKDLKDAWGDPLQILQDANGNFSVNSAKLAEAKNKIASYSKPAPAPEPAPEPAPAPAPAPVPAPAPAK